MKNELQEFLIRKADEYDQPFFIDGDPVSIPHLYTKKQDIEIAGFFAAIFSWGNRATIINKSKELMALMDNAPYDFCTGHSENDLKRLLNFRHRTFSSTDLLYFVEFFKMHYSRFPSLEDAFSLHMKKGDENIENALIGFYHYFFSLEHVPSRTLKHIASPHKRSACKRLCMYLRWMVRKNSEVDFGIWKKIRPSQLVIPLDLHVARVASHFGLMKKEKTDWLAAVELTSDLKLINPVDPVKFDYALFALGVLEKY